MAGYTYSNRGYTDDRNKPSYGESDYSSSDHLCRPVIVDAEGRKRPIISFTPSRSSESYERIVEAPIVVAEYTYSSQTKVEPALLKDRPQVVVTEYAYGPPTRAEAAKNYGVATENWRRPLTPPVPDRQQVAVTDYGYNSPTRVEPAKNWPSSPVSDRPEYLYSSPTKVEPANEKWRAPSSPVLDRPPKVEEFISTVQTEASRPTRPFLRTNWRNIPNSTGQGGTTGYGDQYANYNNNSKPIGNNNSIRDDRNEDYYSQRNDGQKGWTSPPARQDSPLSGPTNDIGKAVEILKEAVKSSSISTSPQPRFTSPNTIDSREAQRRYGNFTLSSAGRPPIQIGETYAGTIDSRTAAEKYNGTRV